MSTKTAAMEMLAFWREAGPAKWFKKDPAFDDELRARFEGDHFAAARGELTVLRESAEGALALVLLLDQFPRNCYRGTAHQFATDPLARAAARDAIARGFDQEFPVALRAFFYLPFEHSEGVADQAYSCALVARTGDADLLKWARLHAEIVARFGRFPHRNACLGRVSTPAEIAFLAEGGFAG